MTTLTNVYLDVCLKERVPEDGTFEYYKRIFFDTKYFLDKTIVFTNDDSFKTLSSEEYDTIKETICYIRDYLTLNYDKNKSIDYVDLLEVIEKNQLQEAFQMLIEWFFNQYLPSDKIIFSRTFESDYISSKYMDLVKDFSNKLKISSYGTLTNPQKLINDCKIKAFEITSDFGSDYQPYLSIEFNFKASFRFKILEGLTRKELALFLINHKRPLLKDFEKTYSHNKKTNTYRSVINAYYDGDIFLEEYEV